MTMSKAPSRLLLTVTWSLLLTALAAHLFRAGPWTVKAARAIQEATAPPSPTSTPVPTQSAGTPLTATATAAAESAESATASPTDASRATPPRGPTPAPWRAVVTSVASRASENPLLAGVACIGPLFVLGVLLIVSAVRRGGLRRPPAAAPAPGGPHLEAPAIPDAPRYFELPLEGVTIGRAPDNGLPITQDFRGWETVSDHHARIYRQGAYWVVEDRDSTSGVYVNGTRTGRNVLRDGWELGIGGTSFIFHTGTGESP